MEEHREECLDEEMNTKATAANTKVEAETEAGAAAPAEARGEKDAGAIHPDGEANPRANAFAMLESRIDHFKYAYAPCGLPVKFVQTHGRSFSIGGQRQVLPPFPALPLATLPPPSPHVLSHPRLALRSSRAGLALITLFQTPWDPIELLSDDEWANGDQSLLLDIASRPRRP